MNESKTASAQLTCIVLTLEQKYLHHHSQYCKTCYSKCPSPVAHVVEHSSWMRRLLVQVPPEIFSVSSDFFSSTSARKSQMNAVVRELTFEMFTWQTKMYICTSIYIYFILIEFLQECIEMYSVIYWTMLACIKLFAYVTRLRLLTGYRKHLGPFSVSCSK